MIKIAINLLQSLSELKVSACICMHHFAMTIKLIFFFKPSDQALCDLEIQEENLWDVVDQDDEAIEEYASNELMGNLLSNQYFRSAILAAILANSLLIVVETDQELVGICI